MGYIGQIGPKNSPYESYHKYLEYYEAQDQYKWKEQLKKSPTLRKKFSKLLKI